MARIALVESDHTAAAHASDWLASVGHRCHAFDDSTPFMRSRSRESFDLYLVDWHMESGGEAIVRWVRSRGPERVPVLITCTPARCNEGELLSVLEAGADDFIFKPMRRTELLARVGALLFRMQPPVPTAVVIAGRYRVDARRREIRLDGELLELTQRELDLALFLLQNPGRLFSRGHLLEAIWGMHHHHVTTRTVDTHVSKLRAKLRLAETGWRLVPVYQHGYRMEPPEG